MHMTGYHCFTCKEVLASKDGRTVCPACGGNLDITYDYAAIAKTLDGRFPKGNDIFRYEALLPLQSRSEPFPLRVGQTPLIHAARLGPAHGLDCLYFKDDSLLPSASFKDRAGAVVVSRAQALNYSMIATASTGNAGASLACLSAALGLPCTIFLPESAPPAKIAQLLVYGAKVLSVRGTYDDAFDLCKEACREFGWYNRNTGYNPFTREGKKTVSFEIWEDLNFTVPDWVVVPTGDGNIISGAWKGWRDLKALGWIETMPRMVCAQAEGSAAISRAVAQMSERMDTIEIPSIDADTIADSISVNDPRDGRAAVEAVLDSKGEAVTVSDAEILAAIPDLARSTGLFAEPSAAAAWAVTKKMAQAGQFKSDDHVVCLMTGNGLKDVTRAREAAGDPTVIDPTLEAVRSAVS